MMNTRVVRAPAGEPTGPLQFACSSDALERDVDHLQTLIRSPVMAARLRGTEHERKMATDELATKVPTLANVCKPLFIKALRPLNEEDRRILGFMLRQMRTVEATGSREGHVEKVSEEVGQHLFDRFVAPKIDGASSASITDLKTSPSS